MNLSGLVIYSDGGCRPNPNGFGGAGIHGYRWSTAGGTRGIGHTSHAATSRGYEPKAKAEEFITKKAPQAILEDKDKLLAWLEKNKNSKVAVECYYDISIPIPLGASNNLAELVASTRSLEQLHGDAVDSGVSIVTIRTDSQYVINSFMDPNRLQTWVTNGFIKKTDGQPVANSEVWTQLWSISQEYYKSGIKIEFEYVKGHGDCPGNNNADWLATTGVMKSKSFKMESFYQETESQGYWKTGSDERHPFLSLRYAYFSTAPGAHTPGVYMTGNQGKVIDLIGKKISGSMFGLIKLKEPVPMIESIVERQISVASDVDYLTLLDVTNAHGSQYRYLSMLGAGYLYQPEAHSASLCTPNKEYITVALNPAFLAARTQEVMATLDDILAYYLKGTDNIVANDITDTFYDYTEEKVRTKKGEPEQTKKVCKLKSHIGVGYDVHPLVVKYHTSKFEVEEIDLKLTMGIDMPERNALRKIEDTHPKVTLVTWNVGVGVFLYATIIESDGDIGIWSGTYSNLRITPEADAIAAEAKKKADEAKAAAAAAKKAEKAAKEKAAKEAEKNKK